MSSCSHLVVGDIESFVKRLGGRQFFSKPACSTCGKSGEVWLCLCCGFAGCGRLDSEHMLKHRSALGHNVAINLQSMVVWCFLCNNEVCGEEPTIVCEKLVQILKGGTVSKAPKTGLKGARGVLNIGNTCFMASVLQCLSHTFPFQKILRKCPPYEASVVQTPQQRLVVAVCEFMIAQWGPPGGPVSPDDILSCVQRLNAQFQGYHQHDAQEFLRFLLSSIHEELLLPHVGEGITCVGKGECIEKGSCVGTGSCVEKRSCVEKGSCATQGVEKGSSLVSDIFRGKTKSTITCLHCSKSSHCVEDFYDLSLGIPPEVELGGWWARTKALVGMGGPESKVSLQECFAQFSQTETLFGQNAYLCEHCKQKHDCEKVLRICEFPEVLVVHLKRFRFDGYSGSKITRGVLFEDVFTPNDANVSYRLTGVVQHMGSTSGGHYIAYNRHKTTGNWLCFDDSKVTIVNKETVLSAEPYILFFQKVSPRGILQLRKKIKQARKKEATVYVPRWWTSRVLSMSVVPTGSCPSVCAHGRPSTTCQDFAQTQFDKTAGVDGCETIASLDLCVICCEAVERYNYRLSIEHKLVTRLDTKNVGENEEWFFIDAQWVSVWRQYLRHGSIFDVNKMSDPGPINNCSLAKKLGKKTALKMTSDFMAVNKAVFDVFAHFHGNTGPLIKGPSLDILKAKISEPHTTIDTKTWQLNQEDIEKVRRK